MRTSLNSGCADSIFSFNAFKSVKNILVPTTSLLISSIGTLRTVSYSSCSLTSIPLMTKDPESVSIYLSLTNPRPIEVTMKTASKNLRVFLISISGLFENEDIVFFLRKRTFCFFNLTIMRTPKFLR